MKQIVSLDTAIQDLNFSVRARHYLIQRANIYTLGDLVKLSYDEILHMRNIGQVTAREIVDKLHAYGYELKGYISPYAYQDQMACKKRHFLQKAHDHFFERARDFNGTHYSPDNPRYCYQTSLTCENGWNYVRRALFMVYGVQSISGLPNGKQEEINEFAIKLTDVLFDKLYNEAEYCLK